MTRIEGTHAVVTGGSSGIGLATARQLAARGARVSLVARDRSRLAEAASTIERDVPGASVQLAPADVVDAAALGRALASLQSGAGPCDVLVACAGSAHPGYFAALDDAVFREQMDVDYFGALHAARAVAPAMVERRRGHIVFVSSTVALVGVFGYSAYAPAKAALRSLAETLRAELAPANVVVACAYPPDTLTPGLERENSLKPSETARISARIKPRDAAEIGAAIVRGIEKDRLMITMDFQTGALARAADVFGPYVRWSADRQIRREQASNGP